MSPTWMKKFKFRCRRKLRSTLVNSTGRLGHDFFVVLSRTCPKRLVSGSPYGIIRVGYSCAYTGSPASPWLLVAMNSVEASRHLFGSVPCSQRFFLT